MEKGRKQRVEGKKIIKNLINPRVNKGRKT